MKDNTRVVEYLRKSRGDGNEIGIWCDHAAW